MADTLASLRAERDAALEKVGELGAQVEDLTQQVTDLNEALMEAARRLAAQVWEGGIAQVWEGGIGNIQLRVIARNEAEALNDLCDKNPILKSIGCHAEPLIVDGNPVLVKLPEGFVFGDDRRNMLE